MSAIYKLRVHTKIKYMSELPRVMSHAYIALCQTLSVLFCLKKNTVASATTGDDRYMLVEDMRPLSSLWRRDFCIDIFSAEIG